MENRQTGSNSIDDPTIEMDESDPSLLKMGTAAIMDNNINDARPVEWTGLSDYRI